MAKGELRVITGTDPAAGVECSETVPAGKWWELRSFQVVLVTDATVLNRILALTLDDGATTYLTLVNATAQTASVTRTHVWATGLGAALASGSGYHLYLPTPPPILAPGYRIKTVGGIAAGDNYGAPVLNVIQYDAAPVFG